MIMFNQIFDAPFLLFIAKLSLAMMLGIILGMERIHAHKTAGMRTYGLVSVAAAAFVATSLLVIDMLPQFSATYNPVFIAGSIITGIGFLGAGLIIFKDGHLENLTTAAGMWVCAGIGILAGFGLFKYAIFLSVATFFVLGLLSPIERAVRLRLFPDPEFIKSMDQIRQIKTPKPRTKKLVIK